MGVVIALLASTLYSWPGLSSHGDRVHVVTGRKRGCGGGQGGDDAQSDGRERERASGHE